LDLLLFPPPPPVPVIEVDKLMDDNAWEVPSSAFAALRAFVNNASVPVVFISVLGKDRGNDNNNTVPSMSPFPPPWLEGMETFFM
jgi:hypothetical protein